MSRALICLALAGLIAASSSPAFAAGFEIGENTPLSNARGGTGAVSKQDPSAVYFNPGRLPFADGIQVLLGSNAIDLNLEFQRDPLQRPAGPQEFEAVRNVAPPFPVPYLGVSAALTEQLTLGLVVQGPHAYGRRCFTEIVDGVCVVDFENGARHMNVEANLLEIYFLLGVGYAFDLDAGTLGIGLSGGPTYQDNSTTLVVDQLGTSVGPPFTEDPSGQAIFYARDLRDWKPSFIGGISWEGNDGVRLGASWRPPIHWNATGTVELDLPDAVEGLAELQGDGLTLETWQAGALRLGWGWATGAHPRAPSRPLFDVEANLVWENWSVVDSFITQPQGKLVLADVQEQELAAVVLPKNYQDTFALRLGSTYAAWRFASLHVGGFIETAAQRNSLTNVDFVSWERYSGSLGFTLHPTDWLDVTASYAYVGSPARRVTDGEVYSQVPLSQCKFPDYDDDACTTPGTPPGNPQNEGTWSS